jgi:hypothetical protein
MQLSMYPSSCTELCERALLALKAVMLAGETLGGRLVPLLPVPWTWLIRTRDG